MYVYPISCFKSAKGRSLFPPKTAIFCALNFKLEKNKNNNNNLLFTLSNQQLILNVLLLHWSKHRATLLFVNTVVC